MNSPDNFPESLETVLGLNILNTLWCESGAGIRNIFDPGWEISDPGLNIPDPQHCEVSGFSHKSGIFVSFGQFPCSWIQIHVTDTDPDPQHYPTLN